MKKSLFITFFSMVALLLSCNKDEVIVTSLPPKIVDDNGGIYTAKVGGFVELAPRIENVNLQEDSFVWRMDGVSLSSKPFYRFEARQAGTFYLTLKVTSEAGSDEADFRIEVYEKVEPKISFLAKNNVIEILADTPTTITPSVLAGQGASYEWRLDGERVGTEPSCTLSLAELGDHTLALVVENEDGRAEAEVTLRVVEHLTASVVFPATSGFGAAASYSIAAGQSVVLSPTIEGFSSPSYLWLVDGEESGNGDYFRFTPAKQGSYDIEVRVSDGDGYTLSAGVELKSCATEGSFRRAATASSLMRWSKLYEYTAAPGQFIGEDKSGFIGTELSADAAVAYAERRLSEGKYLSLGAWGGYLVAGFDHSITNGEGADLIIAGNMFDSSSEPAVVWVMQDSNGNGAPDDMWYELRGSEWGGENHSTRYSVTYFRPPADGMPVRWRDNQGDEGEVPYVAVHSQPSYYPQWVDGESFTLYGSRLEMNTVTDSSGKVIHQPYAWGYADNLGEDCDPIGDEEAVRCGFDISNAVAVDGSAVELQYIDFVRIQCAVNGIDKAMGELSTEVLEIESLR